MLGLLTYKPQLAALVPLALAAGRCWKALAGAVISAVGLALASLWWLGSGSWIAFFKNHPWAATFMEEPHLWEMMPTIFAAARLAGASHELATAIQTVTTLGAVLAVAWVWFRRAPLPIRGSTLALGIFLATPYAFEYDLAILALPFAWLGLEAYRRDSAAEEVFLLLAWALLAWSFMGPPWVLKIAIKFWFRQLALVSLLLLVVFRACRPSASP